MANGGDVSFNYNQAALPTVKSAIFESIQEIFEVDIKGDAVENSPYDTGANSRSIATETTQTDNGVLAEIYTQSGYGGFLELGHRVRGESGKMVEGRPYIYPAFAKQIPKLIGMVKSAIVKRSKF